MFGKDGDSSRTDAPRDAGKGSLPGSSWHVLAESVPGASHLRSGLPNQDSVKWQQLKQGGFVVCVSDGHGSARYFRSDVGSRLAVEVGIATIGAFVDRCEREDSQREKWARIVEQEARDRLPRDIVLAWRDACLAHAQEHPLPAEDVEASSEGDDPPKDSSPDGALSRHGTDERLLEAYGATFLAVVVCSLFVLYLQLGDGDIVILEEGVARNALPGDPRLLANQTTSLCGRDAWKDFRVRLDLFRRARPDLVLVATDGYSNSFAADQDFLQVASDLWTALRSQGLEFVQRSLAEWLTESSHLGSGDDVSLGLLFRLPAEQALGADEERRERGELQS